VTFGLAAFARQRAIRAHGESGLMIVDALAAHWGVTRGRDDESKQVWFDLAAS
jgi:hypothetical protein